MNKPLVTIAIPTYNRADNYLRPTLERAINQTYENIEILISDNCSSDQTPEVVKSYSDPRIKYFRQETNLGAFGNWNFLLEQAKGDYFHMYHDDDKIDIDFIESCIKGADYRKDLALIMTGSRVIDSQDRVLRENENPIDGAPIEDFILGWYQGKVNIFLASSLFGTEYLKKAGGFDSKYYHYVDVAAQLLCSASGERVDIPDIKASFRKHEGSISSGAKIDAWINDSKVLLDLALSLAPAKKDLIKKVGLKKSAKNVYMYASSIESRLERVKAFIKIFTSFGFKFYPPLKYANGVIPLAGYILHPYKAMSLLKSKVLSNSTNKIA